MSKKKATVKKDKPVTVTTKEAPKAKKVAAPVETNTRRGADFHRYRSSAKLVK